MFTVIYLFCKSGVKTLLGMRRNPPLGTKCGSNRSGDNKTNAIALTSSSKKKDIQKYKYLFKILETVILYSTSFSLQITVFCGR